MPGVLIITGFVILTLGAPGVPETAAAQTPGPEPIAVESAKVPVTPRVTVRFHAGPNLNMMKDDYALDEPRDVFANVGQVEDFIRGRDVDFTGGWARVGLVFHFGRQ